MSNKKSFSTLYLYGVVSLIIVVIMISLVVVAIMQGLKKENDHTYLNSAQPISKTEKVKPVVDTVYLPSEKIYIKCEREHCDQSKTPTNEESPGEDSVVN